MSDKSFSWGSAFLVGGFIGVLIAVADVRFSIPNRKPITQKSVLQLKALEVAGLLGFGKDRPNYVRVFAAGINDSIAT